MLGYSLLTVSVLFKHIGSSRLMGRGVGCALPGGHWYNSVRWIAVLWYLPHTMMSNKCLERSYAYPRAGRRDE